ncbi:MAG: hypothetical protein ACREV4_05395 [Gammaproteobacteria bacterium]
MEKPLRASDPSDTIPTKLGFQKHVQADLMELVSLQNIYKVRHASG